METTLWIIALASSSFFVVKLLGMLLGFDPEGLGDYDGDLGHGMMGDIQLLSVFGIVTFLMFGSWTALGGLNQWEWGTTGSLAAGAGAGLLSMFAVGFTLSKIRKLEADGTLRDFDPKGLRGEVYLRIPPAGEGEGQVKLEVKGRLRIYRAVTDDDKAIDSFKPVEVRSMTSDHVMLVRRTG